MGVVETISLGMGVGWAAGLNLYAAIFVLGVLQHTGHVTLPSELAVVADPLVLIAAGVMYCIEFFADKVPGLDSAWDAVHTFVRVPAGAVLAAAAVGPVSDPALLAAGLLGGTLAAGSHAVKAGSRAVLNASPEPVSNWTASITEDLLVVGGLWTALHHPWVFLAGLVVFVLLAAWLLPRVWRGLVRVLAVLVRPFRRGVPPAGPDGEASGSSRERAGPADRPLDPSAPPARPRSRVARLQARRRRGG